MLHLSIPARHWLPLVLLLSFAPSAALAFTANNGGILDEAGSIIELHGVNWFGMETKDHAPHGLWARNWKDMIQQMRELGVNAVRLPLCPDSIHGAPIATVDFTMNKDFRRLDSLGVLDVLMEEFERQEMYVVLDHHSPDCRDISELWYTATYSEETWKKDLVFLAKRYKSNSFFLGLDIKNEPHGAATWGTGNPATDWDTAAADAGSAVLAVNPDILVFVEGIQSNPTCSTLSTHWWGGNFEPLRCTPLRIRSDKVILFPDVYGPDVSPMPYFSDPSYPANMPAIWNTDLGQFQRNGYTVAISEFGGGKFGQGGNPRDVIWHRAFMHYLQSRGIRNTFYWAWNANTGDTGGILLDDWTSVDPYKVALLQDFWKGVNISVPSASSLDSRRVMAAEILGIGCIAVAAGFFLHQRRKARGLA